MALIKCKNCGQLISDKAESCPNCGASQFETVKSGKGSGSVKKNKFFLSIISLIIGIIVGFALGRLTKVDKIKENGGDRQAISNERKESTQIKTNDETSTVSGKGTVNIVLDSVKNVEWNIDESLVSADMKPICVNLSVENIDYKYNEYWDDDINPFLLDESGIVKVTDLDGYALEFFDISGPDNGEYQLSKGIEMGTKAKVGLPYKVKQDCTSILVSINGSDPKEYTIE